MTVHLYATTWNERDLLPLFFENYDWVDHFYFLDYNSDPYDKMLMTLDPRAEIIPLTSKDVDEEEKQKWKNDIWKQSKGKADWVVVQDFDEFVYNTNMRRLLDWLKKEDYTVIQTVGWDVVGRERPRSLVGLRGTRNEFIDKMLVFDPNKIETMDYAIGAHEASPTGQVKLCRGLVNQLHMKMGLGIEYFLWRRATLAMKLSTKNKKAMWGTECLNTIENQFMEFENKERKAVVIS